MSSEGAAISARGLGKTYRIFRNPGDRLKQALTLGLARFHEPFTALSDVTLDVRRGEAVGIIGRNGSGKSTLLQLVCGLLKPTAGTVRVSGRVCALMELGAGFNHDFTGRENVHFQGALMGLSREQTAASFDAVAAFADIGAFIDQPVRTYSNGMFVRLAFAVAAHADPDVLVIDEALSVGDAQFQAKAAGRLRRLVERGMTVLVASHDMPALKALCGRAIQFDAGRVVREGPSGAVCDAYVSEELCPAADAPPGAGGGAPRGTDLSILGARLYDEEGRPASRVRFGATVTLGLSFAVHRPLEKATLAFYVKDRHRIEVLGSNNDYEGLPLRSLQAGASHEVRFRFRNALRGGHYIVTALATRDATGDTEYLDWREDVLTFKSEDPPGQPRWAMTAPFSTATLHHAPVDP